MKLIYLNGVLSGTAYELAPSGTRIGRETQNDIQLLLNGVSRYHAEIKRRPDGKWYVTDLGSTNGTLLNNNLISVPAELENGCILSIGDQLFRCIDGDTPQSPQPKPLFKPSISPADSQPGQQSPFVFRPSVSESAPQPPQSVRTPSREHPAAQQEAEDIVPQVLTGQINLFNNKTDKKKKGDKADSRQNLSDSDKHKKRIGNLLFVLAVVVVAFIVLLVFLSLNVAESNSESSTQAGTQPVKIVNPLVVYYEKYAIQDTTIFRFTLRVENKRLEITLDEPMSNRRYYELFQQDIDKEILDDFQKNLDESGFMNLHQDALVGTTQDRKEYRRILVGYGSKFNDISVSNDISETFNKAESIIEDFLQEFNLDIVSQSVESLLSVAETSLYVAEEAIQNVDIDPANLPKAISNFRIAAQRYKLFDPIPEKGKRAIDGLAKAEERLETIRKEGLQTVRLYNERNEFDKAIEECNRLMKIFPVDSDTYRKIRETKINLERKQESARRKN